MNSGFDGLRPQDLELARKAAAWKDTRAQHSNASPPVDIPASAPGVASLEPVSSPARLLAIPLVAEGQLMELDLSP